MAAFIVALLNIMTGNSYRKVFKLHHTS